MVSFLLVQHWCFRVASARAALKVFFISQAGDCLFLSATFMLLSLVGVGQFDAVLSLAPALGITYYPTPFGLVSAAWVIAASAAAAVSLKSAQFLFFPWLLEAMEAPVPISAQLHSSTLVVIGLFLAFRFEAVLCSLSLGQPYVVLGAAATAALASILGFFQADVKKMLACSTASQLAYVCAAMGLGLWADALALLYVVCVGKAVIFVWFGALMATNGGVSDSRLIVFCQGQPRSWVGAGRGFFFHFGSTCVLG